MAGRAEQQREKVVDYLDDRARRRADSAVELANLQPALAAREQLHQIDQMLDAFGVWTAWASGHTVAVADLTNAVEAFADSARRAPVLSGSGGEIARSYWIELLEPVVGLLDQRGVTLYHDTLHLERAGPDLGLEL